MDTKSHGRANTVVIDSTGPNRSIRMPSDPRRVAVLAELAAVDGPVSTDGLARRVAAAETGKRVEDVSSREERVVHTSLRHTHLPKLRAKSLLELDDESGTVTLSANVSAGRLRRFLEGRSSMASSRLLRTLSNPRRRLIVRLLARHGTPMAVEELARFAAAAERGVDPDGVSATDVDRVRVSFVHSHLPALSAAELIEYDESAGMITETPAEY